MAPASTRRGLLGGALAALAGAAAGSGSAGAQIVKTRPPGTIASPPQRIEVSARAFSSFERTGSGRQRYGRLEFRGGLVLSAELKEFGGWSGLVMSDDSRRLTMVSDQGSWMSADVLYDGNRLRGLANTVLGEIPGLGGLALVRNRDRDAESLAMLDGTLSRGMLLIGFERNHRIGRYPISERGLGAPLGFLKLPAEARRMSSNKGFEALTVIRGGPMKGSVLAFSEELLDPARNHTGWIWPGGIGGEPQRIGLVGIADFAVTDAASLPDGSLLVLERKFRWLEGVKMRMRYIRAADIKPGALLDGEILIDVDMTSEIDNMEGLAVSRDARGQTLVTIVSDDNFNHVLQRSLLLQFALGDGPQPRAGRS